MSILNEKPANAHSSLTTLELALQHEAVNGKNKKDTDFREAYPVIERHLANKLSQKVILDQFNAAYGYKLHPPRFRKMLLDERKRREEAGEAVVCDGCGRPLDFANNATDAADIREGV